VSDEGIQQHPVGELEQLLDRDHGFAWIDIPVCDEEAARVLSEVFGFHPLAIGACMERNAVPKVRAYRDHIFVVLHAPELGTGGHARLSCPMRSSRPWRKAKRRCGDDHP
jgi:Mg2+ and Co2+ transporter CorA